MKSARRLDLGVSGLRFVCLFRHSKIWGDPATSGHLLKQAGKYQDRISNRLELPDGFYRRESAHFE